MIINVTLLPDNLNIRFDAEVNYLRALRDHFSDFVHNYYWNPKYQAGLWDGKISLFETRKHSLPYGLIFDVIQFHKEYFPEDTLVLDPKIKDLFSRLSLDWDLTSLAVDRPLRPYQAKCVVDCLTYRKGIVKHPTAAGKSLTQSYIAFNLFKHHLAKTQLIVVPTISLIEQFYKDLIEYGFEPDMLGKVGAGNKNFDAPLVIATWQTLANNHDKLARYEAVLFDECHKVVSVELKKIAGLLVNAKFRYGFTGTLPDSRLDLLNTKAYLGPLIANVTAAELAEQGYISHCNVHQIHVKYDHTLKGTYNEIKTELFNNEFRLHMLSSIIQRINENVLVLVGLVGKEGQVLEQYLAKKLVDKEIVFLSGRNNALEREEWREKMASSTNIVLIATYPIMQLGVNIPSLKYVIFAAPYRAKIRVLQSIGRSLRLHATKEHGSHIIDIVDLTKYFTKQGKDRRQYYDKEGFNVVDYDIYEKKPTLKEVLDSF